ncbi:hypothetical protein DENSPDRAFT_187924 [Dentipellis sp. KUC8613]|nr:hypothetical protein DENSPDRAFT_187924 [Dentipellis sp. KUC8613]
MERQFAHGIRGDFWLTGLSCPGHAASVRLLSSVFCGKSPVRIKNQHSVDIRQGSPCPLRTQRCSRRSLASISIRQRRARALQPPAVNIASDTGSVILIGNGCNQVPGHAPCRAADPAKAGREAQGCGKVISRRGCIWRDRCPAITQCCSWHRIKDQRNPHNTTRVHRRHPTPTYQGRLRTVCLHGWAALCAGTSALARSTAALAHCAISAKRRCPWGLIK